MLIFSVAVLGGGGSSLAEHVLGLVEDGWDKLSTTSAITSPEEGLYGQQPANQVIIRERYRDNDSDLALGMLAGAATGMALGSLFWVF